MNKILRIFNLNSRYHILECSVYLEEKTSFTLGKLLNIDWKNSDSLGFGSVSLSFSSKVNLIKDLGQTLPIEREKFDCFMTIRNKFAHIKSVNSFESYFNNIKKSVVQKKQLIKWYPNPNDNNIESEIYWRYSFLSLTLDLFKVLTQHEFYYVHKGSHKLGSDQGKEEIIELLRKTFASTVDGQKKWDTAIDEYLINMKNDNT